MDYSLSYLCLSNSWFSAEDQPTCNLRVNLLAMINFLLQDIVSEHVTSFQKSEICQYSTARQKEQTCTKTDDLLEVNKDNSCTSPSSLS